ncbi:MAG: hypothetical protein D6828_05630 [Nitrospirae bacterium]|nr:MAG: hypothetical protein D6828_05630 [Nitrospirota bacterium]
MIRSIADLAIQHGRVHEEAFIILNYHDEKLRCNSFIFAILPWTHQGFLLLWHYGNPEKTFQYYSVYSPLLKATHTLS